MSTKQQNVIASSVKRAFVMIMAQEHGGQVETQIHWARLTNGMRSSGLDHAQQHPWLTACELLAGCL
jgi:hypothetical protein